MLNKVTKEGSPELHKQLYEFAFEFMQGKKLDIHPRTQGIYRLEAIVHIEPDMIEKYKHSIKINPILIGSWIYSVHLSYEKGIMEPLRNIEFRRAKPKEVTTTIWEVTEDNK